MRNLIVLITLLIIVSVIFAIGIESTASANHDLIITRDDVLKVAKEVHPPGCTDSMTADYCTLPTAGPLRNEIYDMLKVGMHKDEVIDALVNRYGTQILAAPEQKGFQWIAWILPFVAILGGTIFTLYLIKKIRKERGAESFSESVGPNYKIIEEEKQRIEKEMKNLL